MPQQNWPKLESGQNPINYVNGSLISTYSVGSLDVDDYFQIEISQNGRYIAFTNSWSSVFDIASGTCVWQSPAFRYSWLSPNLRYIVSLAGDSEPEASFTGIIHSRQRYRHERPCKHAACTDLLRWSPYTPLYV